MADQNTEGAGAPKRLRCEYRENPLGLDEPRPRLSWWVNDDRRGAVQTAYQILAASSPEKLERDEADLWDSGKVESDRCVGVEYGGPELESRRRCHWKVRTWDADDRPSPWSDAAWWEMGLLAREDWSAEWVGMRGGTVPAPAAYLRRAFALEKAVRRARVCATALGVYELRLNGRRVGDHVFAPGWTDYRKRVMYQTYDVTDLLAAGENVLGAVLGEGWYCGPLGWGQRRENFGPRPPRLLLQLEIECEDGSTETVVSDGAWQCASGPIRRSEFYNGEHYDACREMPGWDAPGFEARGWRGAKTFDDTGVERNAQADPPIRVTEELRPVALGEPFPGVYVFDMGQNMVGVCRLRVTGPRGTAVRLRHAEVLNPDGTIYTENLRTAEATDTYVLKGEGEETFTPSFTYHGFRYVEVTGYPGRPDLEAITGLVLHTDCERTAEFESSSELANRLFGNIVWGQRGNMHSVVTDCPQRDERLGWMGDAQVFARTACFNMDMAAMLTKFCRDMTDAQTPDGAFTDVCPYLSPEGVLPPAGAPAWMDAGVIVPWTLYVCYGDRRILERHFDSMARYVDYVAERNPDGIWAEARGNDYGDWVPAGVRTDKTMFATLHFFYSAGLVARAARMLGREPAVQKYGALAGHVRDAFNARYLRDGHYENATQTVNALALGFGIVPEEHRATVAADLVADVEGRGGHLSTGFGGTQWLLPALCEAGHAGLARRLLLNRDYPSWGYMIEKGATAIWELWNSDTEGPGMNSRNHFAYGSLGEWLFRYLAGMDVVDGWAGYRYVLVRPHPGQPDGELTRVRAAYDSVQGRIETEWEVTEDGLRLAVFIPANARARVVLPAASADRVSEGGAPLGQCEGVEEVHATPGRVICEVGAGRYEFSVAR